jgi:diguanylate cyclase (GGDEF)-like protein
MTVLLAGALAGLALVAILVTVLLVRRSSRRADDRVAELVEILNARIDELARELAGARETAEEELRRTRLLGDLAGTIDLDEVLARTLRAATEATGSHAALVWLSSSSGPPMVATLGLSQEEAERQAIAGPPDGRRARAIGMSYRYAPADAEADGELIRSGLAVPMPGSGDGGYLVVFSRDELDVGDDVVVDLEQLAERAGPAIENARRFREARELADLDALTGLHNRRFFHETLAREVARAHRYGRDLALILFDLDDFKAINDRIGHLAGDAVLADAAARVRQVVRSADISCRVGGDEFAVILPEATVGDADRLYQRLQKAVSLQPSADAGQIVFSAGVAGLASDDDAVSFFQKADAALYRAKENGKGRVVGVA